MHPAKDLALGVLSVVFSLAACVTAPVTPRSPLQVSPRPQQFARQPPVHTSPEVGATVGVRVATEGRWTSGEAIGAEDAQPGVVHFYPGAQRRVVRVEGVWTLLELYEDRYGQRGLAWIPNEALADDLVPLVVPPPTGELAYVSAQELRPRADARELGKLPITRCGLHRVHAREHGEDDDWTLVTYYESGVELRGWVLGDLPMAEPIDCRPQVRVSSLDKDTTDLDGLIVLGEISLGREFAALLRKRAPLFRPRGTRHGLVCDVLEVRAVKGGYELRGPTSVSDDGSRTTAVETLEPLADGQSFAITPWGEEITASGWRSNWYSPCQSHFQIVALTPTEIRTAAITWERSVGGPEPYAVSPSTTDGWYRSAEACEAAITPLNRLVDGHDERAEVAFSTHVLSGEGC